MNVIAKDELKAVIRDLLRKYHAEYALLFGSYARGEATADSDIDIIVFGGKDFRPADIFAFGEELRQLTGKDVDALDRKSTRLNSSHVSISYAVFCLKK